jgi:hypothetical protein
VSLGQSFTLRVGEAQSIAGTGWSLTLVGVPQDSRCPANVFCIRAGDVTVDLLAAASSGNVPLSLTVDPTGSASASFGTYTVTVTNVAPYPMTPGTIDQADYIVTLVVN